MRITINTNPVKMNNQNFKLISIEGNIGSGKSTLLKNLQDYYIDNKNVVFLKEPVDEWETFTDENGVTMLEKFYADQDKYSFPFQMMACITRLDGLKKAIAQNPGAIIITERSLYTDKMVFAKMLFDNKKIELATYKIYLRLFNTFSSDFPVDKIVYVKADPDVCLSRIDKRSRKGESNIPLSYLSDCHDYHNKMLDIAHEDCVCKNQLVLNGCVDIYENKDITTEWITQINEFIFN